MNLNPWQAIALCFDTHLTEKTEKHGIAISTRLGGAGEKTGCPQAFSNPKSRNLDKTFPEPSKFFIQKNKHMQQELVNKQPFQI